MEIFNDIEPSSYVFIGKNRLLLTSYGNIFTFNYSNIK
jgi:hypothetical protein